VADLLAQGVMPTMERLKGRTERVRSKLTHLVLARGDVFVATSGGGGGVGDPLLRSPDLVADDVIAGYVTHGHAREIYGVVLGPDDRPDAQATADRRLEIRRERIGGDPARELTAPPSIGVSLTRADGAWSCASCDERLADADGNWRDGSVCRETPIAERYEQLEQVVRERLEPPIVVTREHFCPSCAASLGVDVTTVDLERLPAAQALSAAVSAT